MAVISLLVICIAGALYLWIRNRPAGRARTPGSELPRENAGRVKVDIALAIPTDFLGPAAAAGRNAEAAIKLHELEKAWGYYQEQKSLYMLHASKSKLTSRQALALDASVSIEMANILRLEGRHQEALAHVLYWAIGTANLNTERRNQKVRAYFNRCELKRTRFHEVVDHVESSKGLTDLRSVQAKVREWIEKG